MHPWRGPRLDPAAYLGGYDHDVDLVDHDHDDDDHDHDVGAAATDRNDQAHHRWRTAHLWPRPRKR
ncbi:MAG: hypothetical protein P8L16_01195, partial [Ilumatobacter sp.]|nr:hypothetical protein [Ilumatobacter sp.]